MKIAQAAKARRMNMGTAPTSNALDRPAKGETLIDLNLVVVIALGAFLAGGLCGYALWAAIGARRRASDRRRRL